MSRKKLLVIAGPTAVGKTAVAINLAQHFTTQIISADSRQCYRELSIGVARPSAHELAAVPHHFIASHSIHEVVNAAVFEQYALHKLNSIFEKNNVAIVCGGTGLYIDALLYGLDEVPAVTDAVRQAVRAGYAANGLPWLQQEVQAADPDGYATLDVHNPHRLMRALEVVRSTGRSIKSFHQPKALRTQFDVHCFLLQLPKDVLQQRIHQRVDNMMEAGLLNEVKSLQPWQRITPLRTVGYTELFAHLNGQTDLATAVEKIKTATRQYAKRQLTWFRRNALYQPVAPDAAAILTMLSQPVA